MIDDMEEYNREIVRFELFIDFLFLIFILFVVVSG